MRCYTAGMTYFSVSQSRLHTAMWARGLDMSQELRGRLMIDEDSSDGVVEVDRAILDHLQKTTGFDERFFTQETLDLPGVNMLRNIDYQPESDEQRMLQAHAALATELQRVLRQKFTYPTPDLPSLAGHNPLHAAQEVRRRWNLTQPRIPNSIQLLESKGVSVFGLPYGTYNSFWTSIGDFPCVFLSLDVLAEGVRVAVARHLGHMLLFPGGQDEGEDVQKQLADFVFEFLVPGDFLRGFIREASLYREFVRVAEGFRVPVQVVIHQAYELELIDYGRFLELSNRVSRQDTSLGVPYERSRVFDTVVDMEKGIDTLVHKTRIPKDIVGTLMLGAYPTVVFDSSEKGLRFPGASSANLHVVT